MTAEPVPSSNRSHRRVTGTVAATEVAVSGGSMGGLFAGLALERACLLGDAAFVARPHTAAGTGKAAADAATLVAALEDAEPLDAALSSWSDARTDEGVRLVRKVKRMGDERLGSATRTSASN